MEYFVPLSLKEAESLKKKKPGSAYLAGGTILNWRGKPKAKALIDLKNLKLNGIKSSKSRITIGSMTTIQEISHSLKVPAEVAKAASLFTSFNVRNMATIGGGIAGNFMVSNILPVLIAYESEIEYYISGKKKTILLTDWLKSKKGIVCNIIIKKINRKVKSLEDKIAASDFPSIITALGFEIRKNKISNAVVAVSGASGMISISKSAAKYLNDLKPIDADADKLCKAALKDIKTTGNVKVSARVKQKMIESQLISLFKALIRR